MRPFVIELDDRALSLARGGQVLASAPSAVFDGSTGEPTGAAAWRAVRLLPTATSTRHLGAVTGQASALRSAHDLLTADLRRRLDEHPVTGEERVWIVAPARASTQGLGSVLAIARSLDLPVDGFVDGAAVTAAALGINRTALVLELGLHHVAATAVDCDVQARRRRAVVFEQSGLIELYEAWLDLISAAMVKRTRFDPLHDAATEQQLFDALPALAKQAASAGTVTATVMAGTERIEATLSRDQFAQAAQPLCREMLRLLHELRPAGETVALIVPQAVAGFPGIREAIESFVGCRLHAIPDGFAAAATSLLDLPLREPDVAPRLLRRLPIRPLPEIAEAVSVETLGRRGEEGPSATHALFEGRAYALGADALVVGRAPATSNAIVLPEGLAGVSRRHCTFLRDGGELVLIDHSRYGTFVNGERVAERVRVHAGDRVRIGDPGVEISLIAVAEAR